MTFSKFVKSLPVVALLTGSHVALADVMADVSIANLYLFRGLDASQGHAQVSGTLGFELEAGFYGNIWGASAGNDTQEYDLIAGYKREFGGFGVDFGGINYVYPGDDELDNIGTLSELYLGLSYAGVELYYFDNVGGDTGFTYTTLSYTYKKFSVLVGQANPQELEAQEYKDDYTHLDLSYAYNENLSFTISQIVAIDDEKLAEADSLDPTVADAAIDDDTLFVIRYALPLE